MAYYQKHLQKWEMKNCCCINQSKQIRSVKCEVLPVLRIQLTLKAVSLVPFSLITEIKHQLAILFHTKATEQSKVL